MRVDKLSLLLPGVFLVLRLTLVDWSWGYILLPVAVFFGAAVREAELEKATGRNLSNL